MGFGRPVLVHDTPENREVAGDAALWWDARDPATLTRLLGALLPDAARREALGGVGASAGAGALPLGRRDDRLRGAPWRPQRPGRAGYHRGREC